MRRLAIAALATLLSAPAWAQTGTCPDIVITGASTGTQRVPRMGPDSELLTQSASFLNTGATDVRMTIMLTHRAFQRFFVTGQTYILRPGATINIMLGNVVRPGLDVASLRSTTRLAC